MSEARVKVVLQTDDRIETLWADPEGPGRYQLDNTPFWAYGISWRDVVEVAPDPDGTLRCVRVVAKSGHRTVRCMFDPGIEADPAQRAIIDGVVALGCTFEGLNPRYITIDLPPAADLTAVAAYLTAQGVTWEHADPPYDKLYPDHAGTVREVEG